MKRRKFVHSALAAGVAAGAPGVPAADPQAGYVTLGWLRARRDQDLDRLRAFLGTSLVPAYNRAGVQPVGAFQVMIGPDNPSFLMAAAYPSMAAIEAARAKLALDRAWVREVAEFDAKWDLAYERGELSLLRCFRTMPGIELPRVEAGRANLFELRVYESRNVTAHHRKVAMFDEGEIAIFRRLGIHPVFFGSTIFGARLPSLTYMVRYPSWEARAEAWSKFSQDPEWKKMSTAPGNADRELVSSISNQLMTALPFSQIR
jgi:predicted outer membrane protein